jgi:shikimate kinase
VHDHLALVGLMGSGKSTVGRLLAERLGREFIDTDEQVELATGMSVAELFSRLGEEAFRRYELETLSRALSHRVPVVIATGGGVVTTPRARRALERDGLVVWLRASPEALAARLEGDDSRPLIGDRDPLTVLRSLDEQRRPLYEEVADLVVDVDDLPPDRVAELVLEMMGLAA